MLQEQKCCKANLIHCRKVLARRLILGHLFASRHHAQTNITVLEFQPLMNCLNYDAFICRGSFTTSSFIQTFFQLAICLNVFDVGRCCNRGGHVRSDHNSLFPFITPTPSVCPYRPPVSLLTNLPPWNTLPFS